MDSLRPLQMKEVQLTARKTELQSKVQMMVEHLRGIKQQQGKILRAWKKAAHDAQVKKESLSSKNQVVNTGSYQLAFPGKMLEIAGMHEQNAKTRHAETFDRLQLTCEQAKRISEIVSDAESVQNAILENAEDTPQVHASQIPEFPFSFFQVNQRSFLDTHPEYSFQSQLSQTESRNKAEQSKEHVNTPVSHQVSQSQTGEITVALTIPNSKGDEIALAFKQDSDGVKIRCKVLEYQERVKLREELKRSFSKNYLRNVIVEVHK